VGSTAKLVLVLLGVAVVGFFAWAFWKSRQPGSTGGIWGTIGGLWSGASDLTQSVTEKSVAAGRTLGGAAMDAGYSVGGGVKDAAGSTIDLTDRSLKVGGNLNPANWF
jgi:hypothetical protein